MTILKTINRVEYDLINKLSDNIIYKHIWYWKLKDILLQYDVPNAPLVELSYTK